MAESRRRILFVIPSLGGGGAERVIATLLRYLDRSKFQLTLAVIDTRKAVHRDAIPEDVEFIDLKCERVRYALPKIVQLIWQRRPDVVFSTLGHLNLALAIIRPLLPDGVRYLARETSIVSEIIRRYRRPELWRWAYRHFYGRFDKVVCQSYYMRDDLVESFAFPKDRAVVIHNPVDVERIHQLAEEALITGFERGGGGGNEIPVHLLAAGRLSHEKGFDLLITALALCGNPRLRLTILGEGPLRTDLERLARDSGVAQQVRFAGFQKNPYPFFAKADAFVMSSRLEGFPNVVLEALACGTPVIAAPSPGGVKEILERAEGCILAESLTAEGLAQAIQRMPHDAQVPSTVIEPYRIEGIVNCYAAELFADAVP
ncbi:glycosyltransferase [Noviherbaspirillum massiliense]|uniref:glycosyltransferase n=1 Tax=Noviherbaspirillum massiliense TaxID=1465823 RepID=UPI0002E94B01|nr:glycosyltransferase [Noviherbaspirillum massiliense]